MKNPIFAIIFTMSCCLFFSSCTCPGGSEQTAPLTDDSPEARYQQALEIVRLYPTEEWQRDILARIAEKTGSEVAEQFRQQVSQKASATKLLETRLSLLTATFNAAELLSINSLLKSDSGKSAYKKIYLFDEKLTAAIAPELSSVLMGSK